MKLYPNPFIPIVHKCLLERHLRPDLQRMHFALEFFEGTAVRSSQPWQRWVACLLTRRYGSGEIRQKIGVQYQQYFLLP